MHYDCIVLGLGGMGSATLYHLARRGVSVLGIEQFCIAHARGSSHGQTRLIRKAYFEHADYVPLLERSYALWRELETATQRRLFEQNIGLVMMAPHGHKLIQLLLGTADKYHLPMHLMQPDEFKTRCGPLTCPDGFDALWDGDGGLLHVEACVKAHVDAAVTAGATVLADTPVISWTADASSVVVEAGERRFTAERLLITAGSWAGKLLADLGLPLRVVRKMQLWFQQKEGHAFDLGHCPAFFYQLDYGTVYGFPALDSRGVKVADHQGGQTLDDPSTPTLSLLPGDTDSVLRAVRDLFPQLRPDISSHAVCLYTMTPDENFILDLHPHHPNVAFAAGFSGHGFKFSPVIGEAMADLAQRGSTDLPIDFLRLKRFN